MAKRKRSHYVCQSCGYESTGWMGRCPSCMEWNSFTEEMIEEQAKPASQHGWIDRQIDVLDTETSGGTVGRTGSDRLIALEELVGKEEDRVSSGISELDKVLGGGFVPGSLLLLGGEPGVGKSTLLLQTCMNSKFDGTILYVCGEESASQIKLRADRLGVKRSSIRLYPEILLEKITEVLFKVQPSFVIIDSIQTLYSEQMTAAPGSVSQVRHVSAALLRIAKRLNICIVLVGHVTKEGSIAGPRVLEHMVDTVLYFDGETSTDLRLLRAVKNRFGASQELALFSMTNRGLESIDNASAALLEGRPHGIPGSAITTVHEGSRVLLLEIQALLSDATYGQPQRMSQGFDRGRLNMLLALLQKQFSWPLSAKDCFINVVGGLKIEETASDLALIAALLSSYHEKPLRESSVFLGEVGLSGELRTVSALDQRLREAGSMGMERAFLPGASQKGLRRLKSDAWPELIFLDHVEELADVCLASS